MGKESTMVKVKKENNEANNRTITPLTISIEPDQSRSSLIINPRTHSLLLTCHVGMRSYV